MVVCLSAGCAKYSNGGEVGFLGFGTTGGGKLDTRDLGHIAGEYRKDSGYGVVVFALIKGVDDDEGPDESGL